MPNKYFCSTSSILKRYLGVGQIVPFLPFKIGCSNSSYKYKVNILLKKTERHMLYQLEVCQQKWLRMGFKPTPAPARDVPWNWGRGNPWTQDDRKPLCQRSSVLIHAAFTLSGFDNQERNLTFVKTAFHVLKTTRNETWRLWKQLSTF